MEYFDTLLPSQDQTRSWEKLSEENSLSDDWHWVNWVWRCEEWNACEQFPLRVEFLLVGRGERIWQSVRKEITWSNQKAYFHATLRILDLFCLKPKWAGRATEELHQCSNEIRFSLWMANLYNHLLKNMLQCFYHIWVIGVDIQGWIRSLPSQSWNFVEKEGN